MKLDKFYEDMIKSIDDTAGETTQLLIILRLLEQLLSWLDLCFNSNKEEEQYKIIKNCYDELKKIYSEYLKED